MELSGWTNDREVADRIARLPENQWVYGRPNSSVIMASFLHVAPDGMRFNRAELGAWHAAKAVDTAIAAVAPHLRREAIARGEISMRSAGRRSGTAFVSRHRSRGSPFRITKKT